MKDQVPNPIGGVHAAQRERWAHIPDSQTGATPYERVMGHAPHILEPWTQLEDTFFKRSVLPGELLEQVRRTLALGHGCKYCQAKAGPPDTMHEDLRTSLAVGFAQLFVAGHKDIDSKQLHVLREHFTDQELVELVAFGSILGITPNEVT
jgi:alkylhydroperoxidase family enzyme